MALNSLKSGPLQKKEVRQALRYAINIEDVTQKANLEATPASQILDKSVPGYNPKLKVAKQDVTKAKKLLTDAGYPNGFSLNFTYYRTGNEKVVSIIVEQLAQVGVILQPVLIDSSFSDLYDRLLAGETEVAILAYSSDTYDGLDVFDGALRQTNQYSSPKLDAYIEEVTKTFDPKKRLMLLQQISEFANEEMIVIPLYTRNYFWLTDNVSYVLPRDVSNQGMGVYFWKAHLKD